VAIPPTSLTKLCASCGYRLEASLMRCPVDGARLGRERPEVAVLGSYRLMERLGTGGMGVGYRAVHEKLGRTVAIKVLNRAMLSDRTNVARFFQEARSVNTIRHPNVVDIYDFVTAGRDIYMVMEFLVGRDLHQALYDQGGKPFEPARAIAVLEQVCGALAGAHERNIIHRDLKPANVFLSRRGPTEDFVKLLDFGLAKLERAEGKMTRDGVVLGTPEYMAPEQARGDSLDSRTDLYAVGCIAYHMLTGCQLFAGGSYADVMVRHVKEAPPGLRALNPSLPEALEGVVMRCLSKKPQERPANAQALAQELSTAIGRTFDETGAFAGGRLRAVAGPSMQVPTSLRLPPIISRTLALHRPSRRALALGGVVLTAGIVVVTAWVKPRSATSAAAPKPAVAASQGPKFEQTVRVTFQSRPPGASIVDEKGKVLGVTPHVLQVTGGSSRQVDFVLAGHRRETRGFRADIDTTVAVVLEPTTPQPEEVARAADDQEQARKRVMRRSRSAEPRPAPAAKPAAELDSRAKTINPFDR
jgi:serine/threonine-protein kinase